MVFDNLKKSHFTKFPIRCIVIRALADEVDPWPTTFEGLYEKTMQSTTDGQVEVRSVWLRRKLGGGLPKQLGFFVVGALLGGLLGWIVNLIFQYLLHTDILIYPLAAIFGLIIGILAFKVGENVELFEIPQQPQAAYQSSKDADILWLYQTDLNEYHPLLFKNKAINVLIEEWVPEEIEMQGKFEPVIDPATGKQALGDDGRGKVQPVLDPKTKKQVMIPVLDPKTGEPHVLKWKKQLTPKLIFDGNMYLSGDPKSPHLKRIPYSIAYKSSDLYQWLLLQAERQKFYMMNDFWSKYGNIAAMLLAGIIIVAIVAIGLQQYASVTGQWVTASKDIVTAQGAQTQAIVNAIANASSGARANPPV